MVANGKPAPDLFLHAAREMGAQRVRAGRVLDLASRLEIVDATGRLVSVVTFKDAIPVRNAG